MRGIIWALAIVLVLLLILAVMGPWAGSRSCGHMYGQSRWCMMGPGSGMGGYGIVGMVGVILILALLAAVVVWLVHLARKSAGGSRPPASESPLDVLKRRYAAGEITKEQFEEMKRTLGA